MAVGGAARAGNDSHPRTPVEWNEGPLVLAIDRSVDPVLHLDYEIPREDVDPTDDEVDDSRRHRFLVFTKQWDSHTRLPLWIEQTDVEAAIAKELVAPGVLGPDDVLASASSWPADTWAFADGVGERRPITYEMAERGIEWDTSEVAAGTYVVAGYTWEPPLNRWWLRPGVIKVVDDRDPAASAPSAVVSTGEMAVFEGESATIEGCVHAMDGSSITASYAVGGPEVEALDWVPFVEDQAVASGPFAVTFAPPPELTDQSVLIRIDVRDPSDREYTAHMPDVVQIIAGAGPSAGAPAAEDPDCAIVWAGQGEDRDDSGGCRSSSRLGAPLFALLMGAFLRRRGAAMIAVLAAAPAACSDTEEDPVEFATEVQPIFNASCDCHSMNDFPPVQMSLAEGMSRDNIVGVPANGADGMNRVEPGDADTSYLFLKIMGTFEEVGGVGGRMPFMRDPLTDDEIGIIEDWINQGAGP